MAVKSQETHRHKRPTRAIKDFRPIERKLENVLGSPSLLCSYFSPDICCLTGPCLVLQVWHALKSDKCKVLGNLLLLQLAELKVHFFLVCSCKHNFRVLAPLSLRHW